MGIIDRVKFDGIDINDWLVCKYKSEELSTETKLIVGEGQVAIFLRGGQICDIFYPGTYTLTTDNIPLLNSFIKLPYGGKAPFTAEIYYINTTSKLELFWGTKDAIQIVDPKYGVRLRIRAFGQFGIRICDYPVFLKELIGTLGPYKVCNKNMIQDFFKGHLVTKLKTIIASEIINKNISALDITAKLDELSEAAKNRVNSEFEKYGISIVNFYIESVNFPDEDFEVINKILIDKAAFDIIGESRYHIKRSFDVYEKAAENDGGIGASIAGVGIGMGLAGNVSNSTANMSSSPNFSNINSLSAEDNNEHKCSGYGAINSLNAKSYNSSDAQITREAICDNCGKNNSQESRFCSECGNKLIVEVKSIITKCPTCNAELIDGSKFCNKCGERIGV